MRLIAKLEANGAGTPFAESFHSLLQRTAATHNVKFSRFLTFLQAMRPRARDNGLKREDVVAVLTGTSPGAREVVSTYRELSGACDITGHTLLPLAGVISPRANAAFSRAQRWCPLCLHPDNGTGYGMLAHLLKQVDYCLLHGVRLQHYCPGCFKRQTYMAMLAIKPECVSCGTPLWAKDAPTPKVERSRYQSWAEEQLYQLVSYLSDPERPRPSADWMAEAGATLKSLGHEAIGRVKGADAAQAKLLRRPPKYGYQVPTLLWLAANHSTSLVEVVLRPNEVLTGVFPQLEPVRRSSVKKHMWIVEKWPQCRALVSALLNAECAAKLPSLATLSALMGVSDTLWYRDRALSLRYNAARARQVRGLLAAVCDKEFAILVLPHLPDRKVKHYALQRILARKDIRLAPDLALSVMKAAGIARKVLGQRISIPVELLGAAGHPPSARGLE